MTYAGESSALLLVDVAQGNEHGFLTEAPAPPPLESTTADTLMPPGAPVATPVGSPSLARLARWSTSANSTLASNRHASVGLSSSSFSDAEIEQKTRPQAGMILYNRLLSSERPQGALDPLAHRPLTLS